jgi:hypothetical protein
LRRKSEKDEPKKQLSEMEKNAEDIKSQINVGNKLD